MNLIQKIQDDDVVLLLEYCLLLLKNKHDCLQARELSYALNSRGYTSMTIVLKGNQNLSMDIRLYVIGIN